MQNRIEHIKNIKIYNSNHTSFRDLKNKPFFSNYSIFYKQNNYKKPLLESLITFVRDFNHYDKHNYDEVKLFLEFQFELSEINYNLLIPGYTKSFLSSLVYKVYLDGEFSKFRGEVVEYLIVYLEGSNDSSIYHEPHFYHKRKRLFKTNFPGSDCLIDVVKIKKNKNNLSLIECKADMDVRIKRINSSKDKFKNKLNLMDELESKLSKYKDFDKNPVTVNKYLASIKHPHLSLPNRYKNYQYINLLDHFKLKEKNII